MFLAIVVWLSVWIVTPLVYGEMVAGVTEITKRGPDTVLMIDRGTYQGLKLGQTCKIQMELRGELQPLQPGAVIQVDSNWSYVKPDGPPHSLLDNKNLSKLRVLFSDSVPPATPPPPPPAAWQAQFNALLSQGYLKQAFAVWAKAKSEQGETDEIKEAGQRLGRAAENEVSAAVRLPTVAECVRRAKDKLPDDFLTPFGELEQRWAQVLTLEGNGQLEEAIRAAEAITSNRQVSIAEVNQKLQALKERFDKWDSGRKLLLKLEGHLKNCDWVEVEKTVEAVKKDRNLLTQAQSQIDEAEKRLRLYVQARNNLTDRAYRSAAEMRTLDRDLEAVGQLPFQAAIEKLNDAIRGMSACQDDQSKARVSLRYGELVKSRFDTAVKQAKQALDNGNVAEAEQSSAEAKELTERVSSTEMRQEVTELQRLITRAKDAIACEPLARAMESALQKKAFDELAQAVTDYEKQCGKSGYGSERHDTCVSCLNKYRAAQRAQNEAKEAASREAFDRAAELVRSAISSLRGAAGVDFSTEITALGKLEGEYRAKQQQQESGKVEAGISAIGSKLDGCKDKACCNECERQLTLLEREFRDVLNRDGVARDQVKQLREKIKARIGLFQPRPPP